MIKVEKSENVSISRQYVIKLTTNKVMTKQGQLSKIASSTQLLLRRYESHPYYQPNLPVFFHLLLRL